MFLDTHLRAIINAAECWQNIQTCRQLMMSSERGKSWRTANDLKATVLSQTARQIEKGGWGYVETHRESLVWNSDNKFFTYFWFFSMHAQVHINRWKKERFLHWCTILNYTCIHLSNISFILLLHRHSNGFFFTFLKRTYYGNLQKATIQSNCCYICNWTREETDSSEFSLWGQISPKFELTS